MAFNHQLTTLKMGQLLMRGHTHTRFLFKQHVRSRCSELRGWADSGGMGGVGRGHAASVVGGTVSVRPLRTLETGRVG